MSSEESVKVLNTWVSMFGLRVLIALKHKGLHYEYQEEDLANKSQLLLESNPIHKKIPVLIHNGKPICESLIIVQYIDETWLSSDKPILPKDPYNRAIVRFWADYVDKKVYDAGMRIIRSPEGELREQPKKEMIECLTTLDGALRDLCGGGPYFGGQNIGFVDIALAPFVCWFEAYETMGAFKLLDESQCPHLFKWAKDVMEHPSVKEAVKIAPSEKLVDFASILRKKALGT
ncbi:hypothetical protein GOP47_0027379 [Adiantum capillus-veneris]|nr:hypothetical protein GOP47_0027379 [Adiantum capillus-veneris]